MADSGGYLEHFPFLTLLNRFYLPCIVCVHIYGWIDISPFICSFLEEESENDLSLCDLSKNDIVMDEYKLPCQLALSMINRAHHD